MALSYDATSNSGYQAASGSYNWTHTVGTGNNQILIVSVGLLSVTNSVTALTYNGVALTKLRSDVSISTTIRTEIWYLVAPAAGAHSVAVTLNTASVSGSSATSYNDVDQTNPVDAQNGGTGTTGAGGGSASISTTTVKAGAWLVDAAATPTTFTVGSGQTQRANINGAVGSMGQSDKGPISPAGATTMQWDNIAALTSWAMSTLSLTPMITPNVSDTVVTSESLSHYSDSVDTNERIILLATNFINVSDTTITSEFQNISALQVSDTTTTSENVVVRSDTNVQVSDTATTAEFQNISALQVSDQVTTSESVSLTIATTINVSDTVVTGEFINISALGVSDTVTTNESISIFLTNYNINVSDTTATSEFQNISALQVRDTVTASENVSIVLANDVNTNDSATVSESLSHYSDQVDTFEFVSLLIITPPISIIVSDSTTTSEHIDIIRNNARDITLADNRLLDQNGNPLLDQNGNFLFDNTPGGDIASIAESFQFFFPLILLPVNDSAVASEHIVISLVSSIKVSDTTTTSENIVISQFPIILSDSVTASENVTVVVPFYPVPSIAATDTAHITESITMQVSRNVFSDVTFLTMVIP